MIFATYQRVRAKGGYLDGTSHKSDQDTNWWGWNPTIKNISPHNVKVPIHRTMGCLTQIPSHRTMVCLTLWIPILSLPPHHQVRITSK